jgi:hypothetical protein
VEEVVGSGRTLERVAAEKKIIEDATSPPSSYSTGVLVCAPIPPTGAALGTARHLQGSETDNREVGWRVGGDLDGRGWGRTTGERRGDVGPPVAAAQPPGAPPCTATTAVADLLPALGWATPGVLAD